MTLAIDNEAVVPLAPSCKLVYLLLQEDAPLTLQELIERSLLPERTLRDALEDLRAHDLVKERSYIKDGRQRLYVLAADSPGEGQAMDPGGGMGG